MKSNLAYLIFLTISVISFPTTAQMLSPDEFLPHKFGEMFTPHHLLVDYMHHVAEENSNVLIKEYGKTNQQRPLLQMTISAQENIDNIEKIRLNNLFRAGLSEGKSFPEVDHISIVWLSYSVHGNEASGSESSMPIIYELANKSNLRTQKWLKDVVVLLDPSINPDGYSRYTHWNRNIAQKADIANPDDREHYEPWPGGRVNHYLFDLNRDWAWQTQVESQQRMQLYNKWLPQIHVDFHEMGSNSPYYFAPAASPYHDYITDWQEEFQGKIGKNHAKYFDKEGWLYFTKEVYDLFYPSYGDTYPIFNGAIGMTYEQGGGGRAGRAIETSNGEILKLKDRIDHHFTTALSTIEVAALNSDKLVAEYKNFYNKKAPGQYQSYLVKGKNKDKVLDLANLLEKQGITFQWTKEGGSGIGFSYSKSTDERYTIEEGDLLISTDQPKKLLVQVLMEPTSTLEDSLTYDITAWALPYAYGVDAYASTSLITAEELRALEETELDDEKDYYAIIIDWNSLDASKIVAQLHKNDVTMRLASIPFSIGNEQFSRSSIIITKADNRDKKEQLLQIVKQCGANEEDIKLVQTGFSDNGADLGSRKFRLMSKPNILAISGKQTRSNSFGQLWYYFEQVADYPISIVDGDRFSGIDLDKYTVLILVDGRYRFRENDFQKIRGWVTNGGKLIAVGSANQSFADKEGFALAKYATDESKKEAEKTSEEKELNDRFNTFEGSDRRRIANNVPGAIYQVSMDHTHPLSYGIGGQYFSLKTSNLNYPPLKDSWNVGLIKEDAMTIGFTGSNIKGKILGSVNFAVEEIGSGNVVYLIDNPLFRGFWREGLLLFSNAVFLVN